MCVLCVQIFTLMKQDSFPRFLKSELYKQCILAEMESLPLPFPGEDAEPKKTPLTQIPPANQKSRNEVINNKKVEP